MTVLLTLDDQKQVGELAGIIAKLGLKFPLKLTLRQLRERNPTRFDRMHALIRDIARHEFKRMVVTEKEFDRVVERWKRCDAWPRYDTPDPNYDTGEVLYLPKSKADLDDDEIKGIVCWLDHWIDTHEIPRNGPQDNWQVPEAAA